VPPEPVRITRGDGLIPLRDAARLCGVQEGTIRQWISRGYKSRDGKTHYKLPVAAREGRMVYVDPIEVAKADYHTAKRARRDQGYAVQEEAAEPEPVAA